ncbi:hypothetical protein M422DRAFT_57472 [Sphaerobolus stellatus SS14]|nr:hypothetical protein M422DRAFT_57472 [Sphaerobolus stellatus SS14]
MAQIPSGQLYLVRSDSLKGSRECIYQNAMVAIRRVMSMEYHYQLVITRVFEEGEELILDEDDETDQERSFLIDEALHFRLGSFEGQQTFKWRDLEEDDDDMYEFVATDANASTISVFENAVYSAMFERKYGRSSVGLSKDELKRSVLSDSEVAVKGDRSADVAGLSATMEKLSVEHSPIPADAPRVITEPAVLYLWNNEEGTYHREAEVVATLVKIDQFDYWLCAPEAALYHQIGPQLNSRFSEIVTAITWNALTPKGVVQSYCLKFRDKDAFEHFKETFAMCQYEMLNRVSWQKIKPDEQQYALRSYDEDVEMTDATEEDEEDEDEIDAALGGEEESEEEEEYYQQEEEDPQAKAFRSGGKNKQLVVSKDRSYVENDGRIGVFKNDSELGELQYIATINKLIGPKGKAFRPKKMMLHNQDSTMVLQNADAPSSLFNLDIETGKVVEEWKVHDDVTVDHIAPNTKFSQALPERTLVGASHNALFRVDPRLSGNKMVDSEFKQYASKNAFSGIATTAAGKVAVASSKGDIRLFDAIGKNAKTALPPLGDPIIGIDVTANGRYIIATTKTYLLLIDTLIGEGRYKGQLGFDRSFPADAKPMPKRLQLKPEHVAYMGGDVSFTPARFNSTEAGQEENLIVTGNGQFVVAWDFSKVKRGRLDKYVIQWYPKRVVQDDFRYGNDKDIIVALEDNVLSTNKKQLKPATRQSLARSSIVHTPY